VTFWTIFQKNFFNWSLLHNFLYFFYILFWQLYNANFAVIKTVSPPPLAPLNRIMAYCSILIGRSCISGNLRRLQFWIYCLSIDNLRFADDISTLDESNHAGPSRSHSRSHECSFVRSQCLRLIGMKMSTVKMEVQYSLCWKGCSGDRCQCGWWKTKASTGLCLSRWELR